MKVYLLHRLNNYLAIILGLIIGALLVFLFDEKILNLLSFSWVVMGLLFGEFIYYFRWYSNRGKEIE
jgi:hypothetical protein